MLKKFKGKIAGVLAVTALAAGFGVMAAPAAQAYTDRNCIWKQSPYYSNQYDLYCLRDYNWIEERFQGKRDSIVIKRTIWT